MYTCTQGQRPAPMPTVGQAPWPKAESQQHAHLPMMEPTPCWTRLEGQRPDPIPTPSSLPAYEVNINFRMRARSASGGFQLTLADMCW